MIRASSTRFPLSLTLVAALVLTCSKGGGKGGASAPPPPAAADFCGAYQSALQARQVRCGSPVQAVQIRAAADTTTCPGMSAALGSGLVRYAPAQAQACLAWVQMEPCLDPPLPSQQDPCDLVLQGTVKAGGACYADRDCVQGTFCGPEGAACPGTCQAELRVGAACNPSTDRCMGSSVCQLTGDETDAGAPPVTGTCLPFSFGSPAGEGQPCGLLIGTGIVYASCASDALYCAIGPPDPSGSPSLSGTCTARSAPGARCSEEDVCPVGYYCLGFTTGPAGICTAYKKVGEPCSSADTCQTYTYCGADQKCDLFPVLGQTGCSAALSTAAYQSSGPAPLPDSFDGCLTGWCDESTSTGTCRPLLPTGTPCSQQDQCNGYCNSPDPGSPSVCIASCVEH